MKKIMMRILGTLSLMAILGIFLALIAHKDGLTFALKVGGLAIAIAGLMVLGVWLLEKSFRP